jgi:hypothetical protein
MRSKSFVAAVTIALTLISAVGSAQNSSSPPSPSSLHSPRQYHRSAGPLNLDQASAFARLHSDRAVASATTQRSANRPSVHTQSLGATTRPAPASQLKSLGTGGGDIDEVEPNSTVAQSVSLPVNIFGDIQFNGDVDFFAFQAFANQEIVAEAFAARFAGSQLFADIALFTESGDLITESAGDEFNDPLIRYQPASDQILIVGITDVDGFGGPTFSYLLNLTRGQDIDEIEPNGSVAQELPAVPATVFGEISKKNDVDFYSFDGTAGQTLIVDVDAEVLGSQLDAEVNLSDPETGVEYFFNDQSEGDDPRFNIVLPFSGRFVIGIDSFAGSSKGFYRLNISVVPSTDAPIITGLEQVAKKTLQVSGTGFSTNSTVETNGVARKTSLLESGLLKAKVKTKPGKVVTVVNGPDDRRSNPIVVQ